MSMVTSHLLPRFRSFQEGRRDWRSRGAALVESGLPAETEFEVLSLLGDEVQLRGIPAIGRGVGGAIFGTRPGDGIDLRRHPR